MAWTVAGAFLAFEGVILPTQAQSNSIQPRINNAHGYLARYFTDTTNMPLKRTVLIGSGAIGTLVRPMDDVDLMAVFSNRDGVYENYRNNSQAFIQRVRAAFSGCRIETIGVRGQAVKLFYTQGANVDIAPVFEWDTGGYVLPSGNGSWLRTNPDTQAAYFAQRSRELGSDLLPMIRLLKRWNNVHGRQLKSYHLAVMVANLFVSLNSNRADALKVFFTHAASYLDVQDPAGHSGTLSSYLTPLARTNIITRFQNAAQRANNAIVAEVMGNTQEAIRLWGVEFGSEFPSYG